MGYRIRGGKSVLLEERADMLVMRGRVRRMEDLRQKAMGVTRRGRPKADGRNER